MSEARITSFAEFWPYYVGEHKEPLTRALHFIGTTGFMACTATFLVTRKPWALLAGPVLGYGFAWASHFGIEKNRPATFKYPLWSLAADFVMWGKMVHGTMDAEVERVKEAQAADMAAADVAANGTPARNGSAPHVENPDRRIDPELN